MLFRSQLLKRHRNIMFEGKYENAPISIIITTLAARAYNNETDLYETLRNIVFGIPEMINYNNNQYEISNPAMPGENFAEKWNTTPSKSENFFIWLKKVQQDIIEEPTLLTGIDEISKPLNRAFGKEITGRALNNYGEILKTARTDGDLYIRGLAGGILIGKSAGSKRVKNHTFFGE